METRCTFFESRRRRGWRRGYSAETSRGDAAAGDVDIPWTVERRRDPAASSPPRLVRPRFAQALRRAPLVRVPTPNSTPRAVLGQDWSKLSMESIGEALLASSHGLAEDLAEELEVAESESAVDTGGL